MNTYSKVIGLVMIGFLLNSCSTESLGTEGIAQPSVDIGLAFFDEEGLDRLSSEYPENWNEQNLNVYHLIDGEKQLVFNPNLDYPKHFMVLCPDKNPELPHCQMKLWLSYHLKNGITETYIEYPGGEMDTITLEAYRAAGSVFGSKIWFNGELIWEVSEEGPSEFRYFEVIKPKADD